MAKSITISELRTTIEDHFHKFLCIKNDKLCKGLCVNDVNEKLQVLYNYWWLLYNGETAFSAKEINCILSAIPTLTIQDANVYKQEVAQWNYFYSRS